MAKLFPVVFALFLQVISYQLVIASEDANILSDKEQNALLDGWNAPKVILEKFPYYVSGFDIEKRPVFVLEIGNWPLIHEPTLQFTLGHFQAFQRIQETLAYGIYLNVNAVASQFITMAKPLLGSALERMEIVGTQKSVWIPKLLRTIDSDQLPP
ncbi:unnamed protein product, partial [Allacma fusca]